MQTYRGNPYRRCEFCCGLLTENPPNTNPMMIISPAGIFHLGCPIERRWINTARTLEEIEREKHIIRF
jgi:hypothetical protein